MWLEAIISHEDLVQVLGEFLPVKIYLNQDDDENGERKKDEPDRSLLLGRATSVKLIPDQGVLITCPAELTWSIVGVSPTVTIDELCMLIRPEVVEKNKGNVLEFGLEVKEADFHSLPGFIDDTIVKAVNGALAAKKLSWNFTKTLTRNVDLGTLFEQVEALKIAVSWGKTKVGAEVLGLVVSFKIGFVRRD